MAVYKDEQNGKWRSVYRYTDWTGETKQTQKRGFLTRREALAWEREQMIKNSANLDMTFTSFIERYTEDTKPRVKANTWHTKPVLMSFFPSFCFSRCNKRYTFFCLVAFLRHVL